MKCFYIAPRAVWAAHVDHFAGSSCVELDDDHLLISTDFASDWAEAKWHARPEVARLAHPHYESQVPLAHLHQRAQHGHKQFQKHHFDKLNGLLAASELQPIDDTHTLWDLHARLITRYPGMALNRY